ncbi:MAG TPA: adenylyl-sulfate kinase [Nitrospirota bacterium]|nr:adenylyl-sulfate kinase [Nitrospirota bacterium]
MIRQSGFAIWITGMPASGKSSVTRELVSMLSSHRLPLVVLESDVMRGILTPHATYENSERDWFYEALASIGAVITQSGVNVIFDATANRRSYREHARALIPRFIEVYIECPLDVCIGRDPKGIYRKAAVGKASTVPGLQSAYEPPEQAELVLDCRDSAEANASAIIATLRQFKYI